MAYLRSLVTVISIISYIFIFAAPPGTPMNIIVGNTTSTSFVVQWNKVDDVFWYFVNLSYDGGSVNESSQTTSQTITGLTPGTTYHVTVTASNSCGSSSDFIIATTLIKPSTPPSSFVIIATVVSMPLTTPTGM